FFFFSSRRRHTRSYGDWSSDVCSSDLRRFVAEMPVERGARHPEPPPGLAEGEGAHPLVLNRADRLVEEGAAEVAMMVAGARLARSEERRVGKEGRSGWGRWTEK